MAQAKVAAPGEVARMCMELVEANEDPFGVVAILKPQLEAVKKKRPKLSFA